MAIVPLKLIPTVDVEQTPTLNQAGISSCQLIRFKERLPQKLGGWTRFYPFALSGVPKDLHGWADLNSKDHLAVGTTQQLIVITDGSLQDITPQTKTTNPTPDFTTVINTPTVTVVDPNITNVTTFDSIFFDTPISVGGIILQGPYSIDVIGGAHSYSITAAANASSSVANGGAVPQLVTTLGSSVVTVNFTAHGKSAFDKFTFPIATSVGGLSIVGTYTIATVPGANSFTIIANQQASSGATVSMNSGSAQLVYYLWLGPAAVGTGYGIGGYGLGGYGSGVVPVSQTGTPITATDWSLDNFGETLLACPRGGGIYQWTPSAGFQNAGLVSTGPIFNNGIFVAMPQQILVAWGSVTGGPEGQQQDPLTVRWSDSQDYTNWTVTSSTQAGSYRIPNGSEIRGGLQGPQQALLWTDLDLWAMVYQGADVVWGFNKISSGCGLIGPHAVCILKSNVYWMSSGNFYVLGGGGVQELPCSVWDVIFQNLDTVNANKCVLAPNSSFSEIFCFYPSLSGGTGEIDSYVKVNLEEGIAWDYGTLARSAWIDESLLGEPIGASPQGVIYQHETSTNADGQPLNWYFQTGYFVLSEGQDISFIDWFFPDMKFGQFGGTQNASVQVTFYVVKYPNSTPQTFGPFSMTNAKTFINCRLRGRQISIKFEGSDIGTFARLGLMRFRVAPDGRN